MKKTCAILFSFLTFFFLSSTTVSAILNVNLTGFEGRKELKGELRENKGEIREMRASISAEILAKREEFKLKLAAIKDERKKMVVERVASQAAQINLRKIDQMMEVLNRLTEVLGRIEEKKGTLGVGGNLGTLITTARSAIESAKTAVIAQAQKEYVISITTEGALRTTVGQTISQLEADLRLTREKVIAARKAVNGVFVEFMKLKNEGEASGSGEMTQ
jgi:vacuolar-type H+-ATPase subunit E/Vma4